MTNFTTRPLSLDNWPDLEAVFQAKGCSIARGCWCMFYRHTGKETPTPGKTLPETRRAQLKTLARSDTPPGLVGYLDGVPCGWVSFGPREDFLKLAKSPVMKPVDDQPVWSIVCFVVPPTFRGKGIAHQLLDAAVTYAKTHGARLVEGYPFDKPGRPNSDWLWHGTKSMFDKAGFEEVARRKPTRPVVRRRTTGQST
jgi:ribosomal protein S18 acetylase RimI-like enzyme